MRNFLLVVVLKLTVVPAFSGVQKVDLSKDLPKKKVVNLYEVSSSKGLNALSKLKFHEIRLQWNECLTLAPTVFKAEKQVRGWIALSWIHCLEKTQEKKRDLAVVEKVLSQIEKHPELFGEDPWSASLWQKWSSLQLSVLEQRVLKKDPKAVVALDRLIGASNELSKEQKSLSYRLLGDLALSRTAYGEALFFFQQAQSYKDSSYLTEKISFLLKARGDQNATEAEQPTEPPHLAGEESVLESRIEMALRNSEGGSALKDIVTLLNQYPGSQAATRYKNRPLDMYLSLAADQAREQALRDMSDANPEILLEWAKVLHRRGEYAAALMLSAKTAKLQSGTPGAVEALWIAGRSAHFVGQYETALEHFSTLRKSYGGTEEASEAWFRSALIYYRQAEYSTASVFLEKLLLRQSSRYDLMAQYWLVRSLEKVHQERAKKAAQSLIDRYPFTYYGLRLLAESKGNKLTWPANPSAAPKSISEIYLVGRQKDAWQRFVKLSQAGWLAEAQAEWDETPTVVDPGLQMKIAELLSSRDQYMLAIRLVNSAMEGQPALRRGEFIQIGYPLVYDNLFKAEAKRYGVDVQLLRSLTRQESAFNLRALSTSKAMGLMQMIPPTAEEIAQKLGLKIQIPEDLYRPEINIPMGSFYVSQMLDQFQGSVPFALAAYNAGPTRMKNWIGGRSEVATLMTQGSGKPEEDLWYDELPWRETSFYVKAILRNILIYRLAENKKTEEIPIQWAELLKKKAN